MNETRFRHVWCRVRKRVMSFRNGYSVCRCLLCAYLGVVNGVVVVYISRFFCGYYCLLYCEAGIRADGCNSGELANVGECWNLR